MKYSEIKLNGWYHWKYQDNFFIGKVTQKPKTTSTLRSIEGNHILMSVTSIEDFRSWNLADIDCARPATEGEIRVALTKVKL